MSVEEAAVDSGGAGDPGDADLGALGGGVVEDGDDPLPAAGRVGVPTVAHRVGPRARRRGRGAGRSVSCGARRAVGGLRGGLAHGGGPQAGHAQTRVDGAVAAHDGDGVVDLGSLGLGQLGDVAVDSVDQPPDPGDLFVGGGGVGAGPLVDPVDGQRPGVRGCAAGRRGSRSARAGCETSVRKWSQPAQRNRTGQAPPPARTLDGSVQLP